MRLLLAVVGLLSMVSATAAQNRVQPPPGWSSQTAANGIVMRSPADGAGQLVTYAIRAAEPVSGNVEQWFARLVTRAAGSSAVLQRSGVQREQTLLKESLIVRGADGAEIRFDAMTYPTPQGQQVMLIIFPAALGTADPRVNQAYDHVASLWRSGYRLAATGQPAPGVAPPGTVPPRVAAPAYRPPAYKPPASAPPPSAQRTAQPRPTTTPGSNCRREPVWGQRISPWCKPSGICADRVIKEYRTVCS